MLKKEDIKTDETYWYCLAWFKHSNGQLSRSHRIVKPIQVKLEIRNNDVYILNASTGSRISHPQYYCYQHHNSGCENYFGNFVYLTEHEAWDSFYEQVNKEISRMDDIYAKRRSVYTSFLVN